MIPEGIKEKFDLYRKWFYTFLIEEFLNLPSKYQERFLIIARKFVEDCCKIHAEGKKIKERKIVIEISRMDTSFMFATCSECDEEIKIKIPENGSKAKIGSKFNYTVYSIDTKIWFSSKKDLLKKENRS